MPKKFITGTDKERKKNKVSIVGFAPSTMRMVSMVWDDPDMEVWGLNQLYMAFPEVVPHADRWFQIHTRHSYDKNVARDHSHHDWLGKQSFPVYMQQKWDDIPNSIRFPKEEILKIFRRYFTNSISWEIALAVYEGFKEIHIYGVDMANDSEYAFERPSVEYFCGFAEGQGIKLIVPGASDLLKTFWLYPYEDDSVMKEKIVARGNELRSRASALNGEEQIQHDNRMRMEGRITLLRELIQNPVPDKIKQSMEQEIANIDQQIFQSFQNERYSRDLRMQILGAEENMRYIQKAFNDSVRCLEGIEIKKETT